MHFCAELTSLCIHVTWFVLALHRLGGEINSEFHADMFNGVDFVSIFPSKAMTYASKLLLTEILGA